jgi:hypothetical protein
MGAIRVTGSALPAALPLMQHEQPPLDCVPGTRDRVLPGHRGLYESSLHGRRSRSEKDSPALELSDNHGEA